ncbi:MAG: flagellar biosynthesis protein FlhB [Alphaproteobacteria bacterium]
MADDNQDESQKTEEPTQRRLEQAREKGQVAKSQEINHWFMILAIAIILGVFGESFVDGIAQSLYPFIERPHDIRLDSGQLRAVLADVGWRLAMAVLIPVVLMVMLALFSGLSQNGLLISFESIKPKLEKLSLQKGLKRLFSTRSVVDFLKGVAKISIVAAVVIVLLWPEWRILPNLTSFEARELLDLMQALAMRVLIGVLAVMTIIAALDFLYQKQQHNKELRMSRQDVKEEFKQTEGDPMIKARLRQIRTERARKRMMAAVPEADVVVTNPTHFAVALKYDPDRMQAPVLVAKGADLVAQRIREVAKENDVPIVENPPLSRALFNGVDLDQEVPAEHYKAVAEIIGYIMRLKGKSPRGPSQPPHS